MRELLIFLLVSVLFLSTPAFACKDFYCKNASGGLTGSKDMKYGITGPRPLSETDRIALSKCLRGKGTNLGGKTNCGYRIGHEGTIFRDIFLLISSGKRMNQGSSIRLIREEAVRVMAISRGLDAKDAIALIELWEKNYWTLGGNLSCFAECKKKEQETLLKQQVEKMKFNIQSTETLKNNLSQKELIEVQKFLKRKGLYKGEIDGEWGLWISSAIRNWYSKKDYQNTPEMALKTSMIDQMFADIERNAKIDIKNKAKEEQKRKIEAERKRKREEDLKRKKEAERKRQEEAEFRRKQDEDAKIFAKEACRAKRHIIQDALSKLDLRERLNRPVAVGCRGQQKVLLKAALALTDIEANDDRLDVYLEDYDYFIYRVQKDANLKGVPGRDLSLGNVLDILKNASSGATDFTADFFKSAGEACSKSEEYREGPVWPEDASGIDLKSIDKNDMDGATTGIVKVWQAKNKFRITGYLTQSQIEKLLDKAEMTSDYSDAEQTCESEKQKKIDDLFAEIEKDAAKECESKLSQTLKKQVQIALREEVGFSGSVDGNLDGTREAIKLWQKSEGLAQTGYVGCEKEKVLIANNTDAILEYVEKQLAALEEPAKTDTGADQKPAMGALEIPLDEPLEIPLDEPLEIPLDEPLEIPLDEPKDLVVPESYKEIEMLLSMLLVDQSIDSFVDMIGKLATKKGTAEIAGMFGLKQDGAAIKRTELKALQFALKEEGLYKSSIDGLWGRGTSRALSKWLANQGYPGDRVINKYDISRLIVRFVEEIDKNKEKVKEAERKLLEESKRARDEKPKKVESQAVIKEIPPKLAPDNFDPSSCEFGTKNALVFEGGSQTTKTVCKTGDEGKNDDGEGGGGGDDSNCTN